jgi:hypothetical protein
VVERNMEEKYQFLRRYILLKHIVAQRMGVAIPLVNVTTLEHIIPCLIIAEDQARIVCEKYVKKILNLKNGN